MNKVTAIVAVADNLGIGVGEELLIKSSVDMAFFSGFTQGKCLLVGYNTYQTLPKLVGREIVLDPCKRTSRLKTSYTTVQRQKWLLSVGLKRIVSMPTK